METALVSITYYWKPKSFVQDAFKMYENEWLNQLKISSPHLAY